MPDPRYGEVWTDNLDPTMGHEQSGKRSLLIASDDMFNKGNSGLVIVIPITTKTKGVPHHYPLEPPEGGLIRASFVKCEDIRSISKDRLDHRLGEVSQETMDEVSYRLQRLLRL